jgi:hypothetical protein
MSNIELNMNPYISPVYINSTNMVLPILTITLEDIYVYLIKISDYLNEVSIISFIKSNINFIDISIGILLLTFVWIFINIIDDITSISQKNIMLENQLKIFITSQREVNEMREQETINLLNQLFEKSQENLNKKLKVYDNKIKKLTNEI